MKKISVGLLSIMLLAFFQPMITLAETKDETVLNITLPVEEAKNSTLPKVDIPVNDLTIEDAQDVELLNSDENVAPNSSIVKTEDNLLSTRAADDKNIASGTFGTSPWFIDTDGVLHIGAGEFIVPQVYGISPWNDWKNQIRKIQFDGPVVAAESINNLFVGLSLVTSIENISLLDTSNTTMMQRVFANCSSLTSLDLTSWNTSKVTDLFSLFNGCVNMEYLDVSNWDTSSVIKISYTFANMPKLKTLDLSNWKVAPEVIAQGVFMKDQALTYLDLSGFDFRNLDSGNSYALSSFFQETNSLKALKLNSNFRFYGDLDMIGLPNIVANETYTGKWQNVGSGTITAPKGEDIWTSNEFVNQFNSSTKDDIYVWQPVLIPAENVVVKYIDETGIEIHEPQIISGGNVGEAYDASTDAYQLVIDGYTLDFSKLPDNATGILSEQEQTVTYVYQKKQDLTAVNVHDSTIYVGDSWKAEDNFDSALDKDGNPVDFNTLTVDDRQVDLNKAGVYEVTYRFGNVTSIAQITVNEKQTAVNVHDSTIHIGDTWKAEDNFDSARDKAGNKVDFKDITVAGTVDTSKAGRYEIMYSYEDVTVTAIVVVLKSSEGNHQNNKPDPNGSNAVNHSDQSTFSGNTSKHVDILPSTGEKSSVSFALFGIAIVLLSILGIRKNLFYK